MANFKIGLVFSDTGGGHRSATDAIHAAIQDLVKSEPHGHQFELITDNVVEKTHPINRAFVDFYNHLLRNNQRLMKYYYGFIHLTKPNDSELGYKISGPYLESWLRRVQPHVLISSHPMCNQYFMRALKNTGLFGKVKFMTVVTDPSNELWRGWACPGADLTVVPNELARNQLIEWGVPPERVRIMGMPINPDFIKPPTVSKVDFRHHLGLHGDRLTVCINAGWAGGGNMLAIYRELGRVRRPIQAIFLCGHNKALYEKVKKESKRCPIPCAVLPFHDRMSDLMAAVDLMVTKAGGLTTFEAIARRLPMAIDLITEPMPQEAGNVKIIVEQGLASAVYKPHDIVDIVENMQPAKDRNSVVLPTAYSLDQTDAIYSMARAALAFCDPVFQSSTEDVSRAERH
jgi:UDP-N-acetylglucosamine:LPS N-acetylglucosamine transferase